MGARMEDRGKSTVLLVGIVIGESAFSGTGQEQSLSSFGHDCRRSAGISGPQ